MKNGWFYVGLTCLFELFGYLALMLRLFGGIGQSLSLLFLSISTFFLKHVKRSQPEQSMLCLLPSAQSGLP